MPLSSISPTASSRVPIAIPSLPNSKGFSCTSFRIKREVNLCGRKVPNLGISLDLQFVTNSVSGDSGASVEYDDPFPNDYSELLQQAKDATELALKDEKQLMEIEFPTAGLESVPGDGEGGIEMRGSTQLIREFCDLFIKPEKATQTRIFFLEAKEVKFARKSAFGGSSLKLDYLTKPSFFEDFGLVEKVKMADRVKPEDELFVVEMLVVDELYKEAVVNTSRQMIYSMVNLIVSDLAQIWLLPVQCTTTNACGTIFHSCTMLYNSHICFGNLGYLGRLEHLTADLDPQSMSTNTLRKVTPSDYPPFFYPKLASLCKTLFPKMETVYYINNFKGRSGGALFRCYPGPRKVLRKARNKFVCVHQQETMPSLKEVALDILPSA
ncbi:hypothetical protein LguiA_033876 [Lonicera macranthoides]